MLDAPSPAAPALESAGTTIGLPPPPPAAAGADLAREPEFLASPAPERRVFCNRTLNLRANRAIGFDMDYTLIHYRVEAWERGAYEYARVHLLARGWPVQHLSFDPKFVTLGLVLDLKLGNVVKANRFGYVTRAFHGTRPMDHDEQRKVYGRVLVDLAEPRWVFLNTLFSLSEATLYAQTVDLLDEGRLEPSKEERQKTVSEGKSVRAIGYQDLYAIVRAGLDTAHAEGALKKEIVLDPEKFVEIDPELPLALLDLKLAGKKLLLITNSSFQYSRSMMQYAIDRFLPPGRTWRDLFDLVVVDARKPSFFTGTQPFFEVMDDSGLCRPHAGPLKPGTIYLGGHARLVEEHLGVLPEDILYVGDHVYADVHVSKDVMRWRTALILRDLEPELRALEAFKPHQTALSQMMAEKEILEHRFSRYRIALARKEAGLPLLPGAPTESEELRRRMAELRSKLVALDEKIAPIAKVSGELHNTRWGLLMRAGSDKSYLARQVERYADVYTSRVSNFDLVTPYVYLRAPRVGMAHDDGPDGGT